MNFACKVRLFMRIFPNQFFEHLHGDVNFALFRQNIGQGFRSHIHSKHRGQHLVGGRYSRVGAVFWRTYGSPPFFYKIFHLIFLPPFSSFLFRSAGCQSSLLIFFFNLWLISRGRQGFFLCVYGCSSKRTNLLRLIARECKYQHRLIPRRQRIPPLCIGYCFVGRVLFCHVHPGKRLLILIRHSALDGFLCFIFNGLLFQNNLLPCRFVMRRFVTVRGKRGILRGGGLLLLILIRHSALDGFLCFIFNGLLFQNNLLPCRFVMRRFVTVRDKRGILRGGGLLLLLPIFWMHGGGRFFVHQF